MTLPRVAAFTDTYLPTVNGVTYTVRTWRDRWEQRGSRMDVVYPGSDYDPAATEHPVGSLPFPFYDGFRLGLPSVPDAVANTDVVHAHTPFGVGLGALRAARAGDRPLVASYHTPCAEYAEYLSVGGQVKRTVRQAATGYERWFLNHVDVVVAPSERTATHVEDAVGVDTEVTVVPNGVDTDVFAPVDTPRERFALPDGPLVGYTGRHGHEKRLGVLVQAVAGLDREVTLVLAGDGPARGDLESLADEHGVEARFLGFLDREDLPAFYAALDVFGFPSPVETQGLVALEANACGTPVAGVDAGALADTIETGETGYKAPPDDPEALAAAIDRTFVERDRLSEACLARRDSLSVDHAVDRLAEVYERLRVLS
ncbi:MAG: 1,2-diacylglycerol 3-alpha-glucosyltransferase [Salinirussus sp.]|jgi:1,2-diacylglycerol 3-alpha-glucosyltransferase